MVYKWIGRGQEQKGKLPKDWLEKCVKSVAKLKDSKYWKKIEARRCWFLSYRITKKLVLCLMGVM